MNSWRPHPNFSLSKGSAQRPLTEAITSEDQLGTLQVLPVSATTGLGFKIYGCWVASDNYKIWSGYSTKEKDTSLAANYLFVYEVLCAKKKAGGKIFRCPFNKPFLDPVADACALTPDGYMNDTPVPNHLLWKVRPNLNDLSPHKCNI